METKYFKKYSPSLGRNMEFKMYGYGGHPVIYIPCQDGRFYDFENFHMTDVWAPYIDAGRVCVFAIDTIDQETYSNIYGTPRSRILRHEAWIHYITSEIAPLITSFTGQKGIIAFGCSLGATHAANLYFRFPEIFDGLLSLSGIYSSQYGFGSYMDDLVYLNSPVDSLANMPADHPYLDLYRKGRAVICSGQGPWEQPETAFRMREICAEKDIPVWVDIWGYDCAHDWDWWYKQVIYFLPYMLDSEC